MIKIVFISQPAKAGVKRHVIDILRNIDLTRFDVTYIYSNVQSDLFYKEEIKEITKRGIDCIEIPLVRNLNPISDFKGFIIIYKILKKIKPSIVHLHSAKAGFLGRIAAKMVSRKIRTIYTPNAMPMFLSSKYLLLEKFAALFTDRIVAVSESESNEIKKWRLISNNNIVTIPLCIRTSYPKNGEIRKSERFVVSACGEIRYQKNPLMFFKTAVQILEKEPNKFMFIWVGDFYGDQESLAVEKFISENELAKNVKVTGWINDPESVIGNSDLFCMFSRYESFGYVTADAIMMGVPVLATRAPGTTDLVKHMETGFVVDNSTESAVEGILHIYLDRELGSRLATKAHRIISEKYSLEIMMKSLQKLYVDLHSM